MVGEGEVTLEFFESRNVVPQTEGPGTTGPYDFFYDSVPKPLGGSILSTGVSLVSTVSSRPQCEWKEATAPVQLLRRCKKWKLFFSSQKSYTLLCTRRLQTDEGRVLGTSFGHRDWVRVTVERGWDQGSSGCRVLTPTALTVKRVEDWGR